VTAFYFLLPRKKNKRFIPRSSSRCIATRSLLRRSRAAATLLNPPPRHGVPRGPHRGIGARPAGAGGRKRGHHHLLLIGQQQRNADRAEVSSRAKRRGCHWLRRQHLPFSFFFFSSLHVTAKVSFPRATETTTEIYDKIKVI